MRRLVDAARSGIAVLILGPVAGIASAVTPAYVSCVGHEWMPLVAVPQTGKGVCVRGAGAEVCRRPVDGAGNATSKVTISLSGGAVLDWLERGDPTQLEQVLAFGSPHGELVVATLQSESQGMALRDWNVAYVFPSDVDAPDVAHISTAEFGAEGALVKEKASTSGRCALLVTDWTSRQTKDGERLFLSARLRQLNGEAFHAANRSFSKARFDDRIKKLREGQDPQIPLSLFQPER